MQPPLPSSVPWRPGPGCHRRQQGMVLVITLIMLMLVTMVSVSSIRAMTMEEKMAGNARDREKSLQAAEAALRTCLTLVQNDKFDKTKILDPVIAPNTENWEVDSYWKSDKKTVAISQKDTALLNADPRCMVENLGSAGTSYRITSQATGGSVDSVVVLQATYSTD